MAANQVTGPRASNGADDEKGGGYQWPALSAETKVRLPGSWRQRYIRISWLPDTDGDVLYYLFAPEADPLPSIDESTASAVDGAEPAYSQVDTAPDWIESGSDDVLVPLFADPSTGAPSANTVLILKPSGQGRAKVRHAEG